MAIAEKTTLVSIKSLSLKSNNNQQLQQQIVIVIGQEKLQINIVFFADSNLYVDVVVTVTQDDVHVVKMGWNVQLHVKIVKV